MKTGYQTKFSRDILAASVLHFYNHIIYNNLNTGIAFEAKAV